MNLKILFRYIAHCDARGIEPTFEGLNAYAKRIKTRQPAA